ncbi:hypothetical protein P3T43_007000 [Paraburkholderia sp. GAS41]|jgi:hypothetical protein
MHPLIYKRRHHRSVMSIAHATSVAASAFVVFCLSAGPGFASETTHREPGRDPFNQVSGQVTRLAAIIKDEYAEEYPRAREIKFVDAPTFGRIAVAAFSIESFGLGNNSHQFLAVFEARSIPRAQNAPPYYSLAAVVEVGEGCWVDLRGIQVSKSRDHARPSALSLSFPTFVSSTIGSCNGSTRATYLFDQGVGVGQLTREK